MLESGSHDNKKPDLVYHIEIKIKAKLLDLNF
jgi:hypothetical protein